MPYNRSEKLRRILIIALLAFVLLGAAFGIGLCAGNACTNHQPPFVQLKSYDEVKNAFKSNNQMLFPDLAALELDESTVSYSVGYLSQNRRTANEYSVYGYRKLGGETVQFTLHCEDQSVFKAWGTQYSPVQYAEGRLFSIPDLRLETGNYSEDVFFRAGGHLYCLNAMFMPDSQKPPIDHNALIALKDEIHEIMLDYMNALFEEVKAK